MQPYEQFTLNFLCKGKTTMARIADALSINYHERVSTRTAYQVIRNLRELKVPLVGDSTGIWIATTNEELYEFADRLERKARSDIRSMLHLRKVMLSMTKQYVPSLFDSLDFSHIV